MRRDSLTFKQVAEQYGEEGLPAIGQHHFVKPLKKRPVMEVEILSVTLTDVYVRYLSSNRRSNISHWSFRQWKAEAQAYVE